MKILIDVDGVVVDLVKSILDRLNSHFKTNFKHSDIRTWDFFSHKSTYDLLNDEQKSFVRDLMCEPNFASNVEFIPGVKETLEKLKENGHEIVFLTAPWKDSPTWIEDRTKHLNEELGHISKDIVFSWDKENTPGDILIDDSLTFIQKWAEKHSSSKALIFNQPWNEDGHNEFERLTSWQDPKLLITIKGTF